MLGVSVSSARLIDFERLKRRWLLPEVVAASVALIRSGHEFKARCPLHDDRSPSLTLYKGNGGWRWQCFGCGLGGDVIDWLAALHRLPVGDAARLLAGGNVPSVHVATPSPADKAHKGDDARKLWMAAQPISGTPAETYLRRRNIDIGLPDCLRFSRLWFAGEVRPMLIAAVAGPDNRVQAIHRIVLKDDGTKANLDGGKVKFSLGPVMGGAIRLTPAANGMLVCAGIEEGLILQQQLGRAVWASTSDMALAAMQLQPGVRNVVVAHDNDTSGMATAAKLSDRYTCEGRSVKTLTPLPGFKDFCEEFTQ